jgi:hypothetical protein
MQSLIYIHFLRSSVNKLPDNVHFVLLSCFEALRIVSDDFAVPFKLDFFLDIVRTSLHGGSTLNGNLGTFHLQLY